MDSKITARFFHVSPKVQQAPDFDEMLLIAATPADVGDREKVLAGEISMRLESLTDDGEFLEGEMCRKQTANIPPSAFHKGLEPLQLADGRGLGHLAAFMYHRPTRVLLLQHNLQCASPPRFSGYVAAHNAAAFYVLEPILREDAWERFKDKKLRSMEIEFATPANLRSIYVDDVAASKAAKLLAEAYDGMRVRLYVGVGKSTKRFLRKETVMETIAEVGTTDEEVKKLRVTATQDGVDDPIDFIREHLKDSKSAHLDMGDMSKNYEVRKNYLRSVFSGNMSYLKRQFGPTT